MNVSLLSNNLLSYFEKIPVNALSLQNLWTCIFIDGLKMVYVTLYAVK